MATRKKKQIRYITDGDLRNSENATRNTLISGALFDSKTRIVELKITAIPGFGVFINDTPKPIRIFDEGAVDDTPTYTFQNNVLALQPVYNIKCEAASIQRLIEYNRIADNQKKALIIDYVEEVND